MRSTIYVYTYVEYNLMVCYFRKMVNVHISCLFKYVCISLNINYVYFARKPVQKTKIRLLDEFNKYVCTHYGSYSQALYMIYVFMYIHAYTVHYHISTYKHVTQVGTKSFLIN